MNSKISKIEYILELPPTQDASHHQDHSSLGRESWTKPFISDWKSRVSDGLNNEWKVKILITKTLHESMDKLVGGFDWTPLKNISHKQESSPIFGVKIKRMKPPPSNWCESFVGQGYT